MKRFAGRVVLFLFIASLMYINSPTALAAYGSYTGSIATYQDFRNGTNNTVGYDADGYYGRQCWDGVQILYRRLGMSLSTGNIYNSAGEREAYAKHCWTTQMREIPTQVHSLHKSRAYRM